MVKDHSDSERDATMATLSELQQGLFYMYYPIDRVTRTTFFVIPVVEH